MVPLYFAQKRCASGFIRCFDEMIKRITGGKRTFWCFRVISHLQLGCVINRVIVRYIIIIHDNVSVISGFIGLNKFILLNKSWREFCERRYITNPLTSQKVWKQLDRDNLKHVWWQLFMLKVIYFFHSQKVLILIHTFTQQYFKHITRFFHP